MNAVLVLGTDTGVGKTFVASILIRALLKIGVNVIPFKPIETGVKVGIASDAELLIRATDKDSLRIEDVCLYPFHDPVAPALAAKRAGVEISEPRILEQLIRLRAKHGFVVVESPGAVMTPIVGARTNLDLAEVLSIPIILVGKNGLGTISQTSLAIGEISRRRLALQAVFLSTLSSEETPDQIENACLVERVSGVSATSLPYGSIPLELNRFEALIDLAKVLKTNSNPEFRRIEER